MNNFEINIPFKMYVDGNQVGVVLGEDMGCGFTGWGNTLADAFEALSIEIKQAQEGEFIRSTEDLAAQIIEINRIAKGNK